MEDSPAYWLVPPAFDKLASYPGQAVQGAQFFVVRGMKGTYYQPLKAAVASSSTV
jgi:hypothetical protein